MSNGVAPLPGLSRAAAELLAEVMELLNASGGWAVALAHRLDALTEAIDRTEYAAK